MKDTFLGPKCLLSYIALTSAPKKDNLSIKDKLMASLKMSLIRLY